MAEIDQELFDPYSVLTEFANQLNANCEPDESSRVGYEIMSGALVWSDETNIKTPINVIWALRILFAYRTGLILNKPREEFKPLWEYAKSLFPKWVGFRPERLTPSPELLKIFRRGSVSLRKCLKKIEH